MDEILATIRRIIAEDEGSTTRPGEAASSGAGTGSAGVGGPADDDVLELTDALNEDGTVRRLTPVGSSSSENAREPPAPIAPGEADAKPDPQASDAAAERQEPHAGRDERLVSEVTTLAAAAAFARLAATPRPKREIPLVGDRRLEDIVRELLRPLLQTWLDENLPAIVERLVEAEIARVTAKSGPP